MEKIYEQAKDLHVKSRVVYVVNGHLYDDSTGSTPTKVEEAFDAYVKGLLLIKLVEEAVVYWIRPIAFGSTTVYAITPDGVPASWGFVTEETADSSDPDPNAPSTAV